MREQGQPPRPPTDRGQRQPPRSRDEFRPDRRLPAPPSGWRRPAPAPQPQSRGPLPRPTSPEKLRRRSFLATLLGRWGPRKAAIKPGDRRSPPPDPAPRGGQFRAVPDQRPAHIQSARRWSSHHPENAPRQRRERAVSLVGKAAIDPRSLMSTPKPPRSRTKLHSALIYGARLLILGVGVGAIAGTILQIWDPARHLMAEAQGSKQETAAKVAIPAAELRLDQEIGGLKSDVQALVAQQSGLNAGMLFVDLDTNSYLDLNAAQSFSAASTIKFPVLVAFFQDVDAGKIQLDEMLTMRKDLVTPESGEMQYQPVGTKFSALETANRMITVSDNTATNMLIDRLGGQAALDQRFQTWGLTVTQLRRPLPDLEGTNTTSAKDLVTLMGFVNEGKLLSLRSRDRLLDIMRRTVNTSLLPKGLGEGATIAHKTGDIGSLVGDIGMIDTPNGRRYLAAVLVKRPFNDDRAQELIRQISQTTYKYFSQPLDLTQARKGQNPSNTKNQIDLGNDKVAQP